MSDTTANTAPPPPQADAPVMPDRREPTPENALRRSIFSVPLEIEVCIGAARPTVSELLDLRKGSILKLDSRIDDPVSFRIEGRVIARGELIEMDGDPDRLGVRITEIVDPDEEDTAP